MITIDSKTVINPVTFKDLMVLNRVQAASIGVTAKGLVIVLRIGKDDSILGQYRGGPRYFQSFDAAASTLLQNGITEWETDAKGWIPKTVGRGKTTRIGNRVVPGTKP
ncbi:hypothetical protein ALP73_200054 [Pseudomonas coronafaciens pv. garcae]|uniref:ParC family partition-associated protein n=1 Tax=Pseudomonas syringae group TaxID=136849 RepID=UPI000F00F506|nr:ParC family partition-associated protein [Pseudomonas coronafaciens]RMS04940.1 hypothetical protein ALP73_200054 [Pseudomonas coronafaciens pv. garcae]